MQQLGLPQLDIEAKPVELWNGESVMARLKRQFASSQAEPASDTAGDGDTEAAGSAARLEWLRRIMAEKLPDLGP